MITNIYNEDNYSQYKDLIEHLIEMYEKKSDECNLYKTRLGEIMKIMTSELKVTREGKIEKNE